MSYAAVDLGQIKTAPSGSDSNPIMPVPEGTALVVPGHRLGSPSNVYQYRNAGGQLLYAVARFELLDGQKEFSPLTYRVVPGRGPMWAWKGVPSPRPIYGLDRLAARPKAPVLIVEGEKTADAAAMHFPDFVAITSCGGSDQADRADWSPIGGRDVTIWPDHDTAGTKYAADVARLVLEAAATSVRIVSVPQSFPVKWDLANDLPEGIDAEMRERLARDANPYVPEASAGPDFTVLRQRRSPPELALEVFGPLWADWIAQAAEAAGCPKDYVAGALLAGTAALIGNTRVVEAWPGWKEPSVLWIAAVADPSSNKSPGTDMVREALRTVEEHLARDFDQKHRAWKRDAIAATAAQEAWKHKVEAAAAKGGTCDLLSPPDPPPEPVAPRVLISDATPEALANISARNPRGLLLFRDELSGWFKSFERYSNASGRPMWTEAYGARPFTIDRVKHPQPIHILRLSVSVLGTIQPDRFAEVLKDADDGLAARVLWFWPEKLPPARPSAVPSATFIADAFKAIADLSPATEAGVAFNPLVLPLAPLAADEFQAWREDHFHAEDEGGSFLASALGKLPGIVLRLALVFEHLWWSAEGGASPHEVSVAAVRAAMMLVETYLKPMAERVYGDAALPQADRNMATLARWLRRTRPDSVNAREVRRKRIDGLKESDAVKAAINSLVEARILIDETKTREGGSHGQMKVTYRVDPRFYQDDAS